MGQNRRVCCIVEMMPIVVIISLLLFAASPMVLWITRTPSTEVEAEASVSCSPPYCSNISSIPFTHQGKENGTIKELRLKMYTSEGVLQRYKSLVEEAKKASSHYKKEAEKCNKGVDACEKARQRAQAALVKERKLTTLWERIEQVQAARKFNNTRGLGIKSTKKPTKPIE